MSERPDEERTFDDADGERAINELKRGMERVRSSVTDFRHKHSQGGRADESEA